MKQIVFTIKLNVQDVNGLAEELAYEIDDFLTNQGNVTDWEINFYTKLAGQK